jgi:hypothetical protein
MRAAKTSGYGWINDTREVEMLEKLLELCRTNGIEPILVYSPDYLEARDFFLSRQETIQAFRTVARSTGVRFWDFSDDPVSNNKACFYNSQHLNAVGAELFSQSLASRFRLELLSRNPASSKPIVSLTTRGNS